MTFTSHEGQSIPDTDDNAELVTEQLLGELRNMREAITATELDLATQYDERAQTWLRLRDRGVTNRVLAEASGVSEPAVSQGIGKLLKRAADQPGS